MKQDETEAYLRSVIHVTRETIEKNRDISDSRVTIGRKSKRN